MFFVLLTACQTNKTPDLNVKPAPAPQKVSGVVSSFYPDVTKVGVQILQEGGTAADAVTAMGFYLAVTEPSRVSLLGTGQCLISDGMESQKVSFVQTVPETRLAVPVMARGLFTLHAREGQLGWRRVLAPAVLTAKTGFSASKILVDDFERGGRIDFGSFLSGQTDHLKQGMRLKNPVLSQTLTEISEKGTGILYQPPYGTAFIETLAARHISVIGGQLKGNKPVWEDELPVMTQAFIGPASIFAMDKNGLAVQCAFEMDSAFGSGYYVDEIGAFIADVPRKISDMNKTRVLSCPKGLTIQTENCQINQSLLAEQKTKVVYE